MPYADPSTPLSDVLHGSARLHAALAKSDGIRIPKKGWRYNDLVDGCLSIGCGRQDYALETLWDALDGLSEIGPSAVDYLGHMSPT